MSRPELELVFELEVTCDAPVALGRTSGEAMMIPITGGRFWGPAMAGEVLSGGADWAVRLDNGALRIDARYAIRTDDGVIIQVHNRGNNHADPQNNPSMVMLTTPSFIAPQGTYDWLNDATFIATVTPDLEAMSGVHVHIYRAKL